MLKEKFYETNAGVQQIMWQDYWLVRVVHDCGVNKTVIKEVEFGHEPTDDEILDVLMHVTKSFDFMTEFFASVVHNYKLLHITERS